MIGLASFAAVVVTQLSPGADEAGREELIAANARAKAAVAQARAYAQMPAGPAYGGFSEVSGDELTWRVHTVHWRGRELLVRRTSSSPTRAIEVAWAATGRCPALLASLRKLGRLQAPPVELPLLEKRRGDTPPPTLGPVYSAWSTFTHDRQGSAGQVEMRNAAGELRSWYRGMAQATTDCWTLDMPPLARVTGGSR